MCTLEKRGRILILTLTGDGEHRLSLDLIASLRSALSRARSDPSAAALITTASLSSKFFSNGFDLASAAASPSPALALHSMTSAFIPLVADFLSLPMPTIAAVTGHAAAAGFMLAVSHDYIAMRSDRGVLYMSELDLGLPFPPYFLALMRSKMGDPRVLRDVVLRSAKFTAAEAKERGVIDIVKPTAAETVEAAVKLAEDLAKRNWGGSVYASIRRAAFPEVCRAVGLPEESEGERQKLAAAKL